MLLAPVFKSYILRFHWHIFGESLLHLAKVQLFKEDIKLLLSPSSLNYLGFIV
ncbi:hypothetical protein Gotur_025689 [Gossypium turneri]